MFALIKSFNGLGYYGDIPELPDPVDNRVDVFTFSEGDRELLTADFANPINHLCNATLDIGDVDFFDADKCEKILAWLRQREKQGIKDRRLNELYTILEHFLKKAINLHTGVIIEL